VRNKELKKNSRERWLRLVVRQIAIKVLINPIRCRRVQFQQDNYKKVCCLVRQVDLLTTKPLIFHHFE